MDTVLTIVRLRWALTWAALRKSVWQTIGYVISLLMGVAVVVGTGLLAWFLGDPAGVNNAAGFAQGLEVIVVLLGAFITLMTAFAQLMLIGESSTMSPRKLELYGIPDRTLQAGLLAAGLSGIPAICAIIALMLWSLAYRWMGIGVLVAAIIAAPLTVITVVSFSKMVINAATTLVRSNRGKNLFYIIVMITFVAICYVPSITLNASMEAVTFSIETFAAPVQHRDLRRARCRVRVDAVRRRIPAAVRRAAWGLGAVHRPTGRAGGQLGALLHGLHLVPAA